jgi:hypothetical protein
MSERQKIPQFDIVHWRERFVTVKANAPKNWMAALAKFNAFYNTHEGTITMISVTNKRAGLAKTAKVVQDLEEMLATPVAPVSKFDKWKKKKLVK